MPSAQALSKMNAKALDNLIHNSNRVPVTGISFVQASASADHKYETSVNIDPLLIGLIANRGVAGTLSALGGDADAFRIVWDFLDDNYTYYNTGVNHGFIDLAIAYGDYLKAGGSEILDIVKYAPDGADADSAPDRLQTMQDNILGNLHEASIADKFGAAASGIFEQIQDAGYGAFLGVIGDFSDGRAYYGGNNYETTELAAHAFDQNFF